MNKSNWIKDCVSKNGSLDIKTDGGYTFEQIMDNKNCSKDISYWYNIAETEKFLFKSSVAESWEFFDNTIINPIRNTNQIYLRFLKISDFIPAANYYRKYGIYTHHAKGTLAFNNFWMSEEKKCLNGIVVDGVYMTGRYYFSINFGTFKAFPVDEFGDPIGKRKQITLLRFIDVQYYLFHELEEILLSGNYSDRNKYLEWFPTKTRIDFAELKYDFFAASKGRRKGWSAVINSGGIVYNFVFLAESKTIIGSEEKAHYNALQKGIKETRNTINKHTPWKRPTGILGRADHFITGIKTELADGTVIEEGYKSEIQFLSFPDAYKGIGDSAELIVIEEPGKFTKLIETLKISIEPVLREGDSTIGPCVLGGTAGDIEAGGSIALQEIMYHPKAYGFKEYDNIYEEVEVNTKSGWFIDDLWFLSKTISKEALLELDNSKLTQQYCDRFEGDLVYAVDKYGNSYRHIAKILLMSKREREKLASREAYQNHITQQPMYLSEAFLVNTTSPFDIGLAKEALMKLYSTEDKIALEKGKFMETKTVNGVSVIEWKLDMSLNHINRYPWKSPNKEGCWVIYSHPVKSYKYVTPEEAIEAKRLNPGDPNAGRSEYIEPFRYIAGTDPIDWGTGETTSVTNAHSLASTWVIDTYTRQIVAEYVSRPYSSDMYFEELRKGLEYFNAIDNPETNLKGLVSYFKAKNKSYLLCDELQSLKDKLNINPSKNPTKGTKATPKINNAARELIHRWSTEMVRVGQDDKGNDIELPRMMTIQSISLLEEMIKWTHGGNFDNISGLGMAMLLLFDKDYSLMHKSTVSEDRFTKGLFKQVRNNLKKRNLNYGGLHTNFR